MGAPEQPRSSSPAADETLGHGVDGHAAEPFQEDELALTVAAALERRQPGLESRPHLHRVEELVLRRTREIEESRAETVERLARAVESRDPARGEHIERMSGLARRLARELGWSECEAETLRHAAALHDIGNVGIPDEILLKPGPLDPDERGVIESHAPIGHGLLAGARSAVLRLADVVAWTHHERYDGSGYPRALVGAEIPMAGRIAAVADVFDALTSDRSYRAALSPAEALAIIAADRGRAFDPAVVDALSALVG